VQLAIALLVLAGAVAYCGWLAWRVFTGRSTGCGCSSLACPKNRPRR